MRFPDLGLFIPAVLLSLLGLLVIYSIDAQSFSSQSVYLVMSLVVFFLVSQLDFQIIEALGMHLFLGLILLLVITLTVGHTVRGSSRWISLGGIRLQVSEFAKPILVLYLSHLSYRLNINRIEHIGWILGAILLPTLLVFLQPDLGSSLIILGIGAFGFLALGPSQKWLILLALITALGLPSTWSVLAPYQQQRVLAFLQPQADPLGASYNQIQATIAAGSGLWIGKGLGKGTQSHLKFLPEKHTDFIFASLAEEMGFVGSSVVLGLVAWLCGRLLYLARDAQNLSQSVLFIGIFGLFLLQSSIHIGINLGILPVTGLTLPFISVGGSSLLSSWLCLGIAASAAQTIKSHHTVFLRY